MLMLCAVDYRLYVALAPYYQPIIDAPKMYHHHLISIDDTQARWLAIDLTSVGSLLYQMIYLKQQIDYYSR